MLTVVAATEDTFFIPESFHPIEHQFGHAQQGQSELAPPPSVAH